MAKIGDIQFHPQGAFSQLQRQEIIAYVTASLKGVHGFSPIEEVHDPRYIIRCRNRQGYTKWNPWKRSFKVVFDYDVYRPAPRSMKPVGLNIRR